jgi:aquaporin Z
MATKKAASSAKKSGHNKPNAAKQTTTNVTTVKAVESHPTKHVEATGKKLKKMGLNNTSIFTAAIAEFLGTFVFAAAIIAGQDQPILALFALAGVVLVFGTVSGAYVNPALVLGAWITRRIDSVRAVVYIVAQVLGAMLALVVLNTYINAAPAASATDVYSTTAELFKAATLPTGKEWYVFFSEFIGMLIFGFAAASLVSAKKDRIVSSLTMGLGVFLGLMIAGSASVIVGANAILNPAVAVSLQAINFTSVWPTVIYIVGASLGAIIGYILYDLLRTTEESQNA